MAITEVFPNPTVKRVIFQIRFPHFFSMESLVGQYQLDILDRFPESDLLFQKQIVFVAGADPKDTALAEREKHDAEGVEKIWRFKSEFGVEMNIRSGSLDMSSTSHKTYNNLGSENRFRDLIEFALVCCGNTHRLTQFLNHTLVVQNLMYMVYYPLDFVRETAIVSSRKSEPESIPILPQLSQASQPFLAQCWLT